MREDDFRREREQGGYAPNTINTQCSVLKRIERAEEVDLDEPGVANAIRERFQYSRHDERAGRPNPSRIQIDPENLYRDLAFFRSALASYIRFLGEAPVDAEVVTAAEAEVEEAAVEAATQTFGLERDLQVAVRSEIEQLESGLQVADDGREARVGAGLIDILARDRGGQLVIIELKAETARLPVIAQTLAYMTSVAEERGGAVRGMIVASDFDPRVELAARAVPSLQLVRYRYRFAFEPV